MEYGGCTVDEISGKGVCCSFLRPQNSNREIDGISDADMEQL